MVFIQVGVPDFDLRIWDIVYLTDEHRHSVHGYELRLQGTAEGWITGQDNGLLFCVSVEHRNNPCMLPSHRVIIEVSQRKATSVDLSVEYSRNSISKPSHLHDGHSHRAL